MTIDKLHSLGFDESYPTDDGRYITVKCSQCSACAISGVRCHESGCPNETFPCSECENGCVSRAGSVCEDCAASDSEFEASWGDADGG